MLNRLRSLPRPKTAALLASVAALLSAGILGAAAPARAQDASRVTVAVLPLDGTRQDPVVYGDDASYDTASIIKVDILAAVLLRAQDAGRSLTARERAWAGPMIRESDNAAANALWQQIGRAPGLAAANGRLGLTDTQGGPGTRWGLTRTTASDQIRLLRAVFDPPQPGRAALSASSRSYLRTLMSSVSDEQTWGVSAAGSGSDAALKNGWLQRSTTGLWDVNSIGRITVGGHRCLVAVLSSGNASMDDGISLVQRTARTAVDSVAGR